MEIQLAAMQIREWRSGDFEALYELDRACFPAPIAYSRRTLRKFLGLPGAECLIAEAGGLIAGFILTHCASELASRRTRTPATAQEQTPRRGHIISLDVGRPFRRSGIGSALLRAAEKSLMTRGVRAVDLETAVDNPAAVAFWRRHGYAIAGTIANYYDDGGDAFAMSKIMPREASG
jgi:ribosomal-protein-alanine N-acetyltransferase